MSLEHSTARSARPGARVTKHLKVVICGKHINMNKMTKI